MGTFRNVWGPDHYGPTSACVDCGAIVHSPGEAFRHRCPGHVEIEVVPVREKKPRPEFPWMRLIALLILIVTLTVLGVFLL